MARRSRTRRRPLTLSEEIFSSASRSVGGAARRVFFSLLLSKKSLYDASRCSLGFPEARERRAHRKRAGIARVDAGHHRPRAVQGRLLAEAPREEGVNALVLQRRRARRDERLLEEAQLSPGREDLVEERCGTGYDGARGAAAHDPARRLAVGLDGPRLEAQIRDEALGGFGRA